MHIALSPQRRDEALVVSKEGDVLTINGEPFDFSGLPDGGTIPADEVPSPWLAGPVDRIAGDLHLTLLLPHGANSSPAVAFPDPLINPPDGELALPHDQEISNVDR